MGSELGKGAFGAVYNCHPIENENIGLALKQIGKVSLEDLSQIIIESQFNMFFSEAGAPLVEY